MIPSGDFLSSKRGQEFDSPASREQLKKRFDDLGKATVQRFRDAAAPTRRSGFSDFCHGLPSSAKYCRFCRLASRLSAVSCRALLPLPPDILK
jgi:hypothetical protein